MHLRTLEAQLHFGSTRRHGRPSHTTLNKVSSAIPAEVPSSYTIGKCPPHPGNLREKTSRFIVAFEEAFLGGRLIVVLGKSKEISYCGAFKKGRWRLLSEQVTSLPSSHFQMLCLFWGMFLWRMEDDVPKSIRWIFFRFLSPSIFRGKLPSSSFCTVSQLVGAIVWAWKPHPGFLCIEQIHEIKKKSIERCPKWCVSVYVNINIDIYMLHDLFIFQYAHRFFIGQVAALIEFHSYHLTPPVVSRVPFHLCWTCRLRSGKAGQNGLKFSRNQSKRKIYGSNVGILGCPWKLLAG